MHPYALPVAAGALLACCAVVVVYRVFLSPLSRVPGPFLARFTDLWYLWRLSKHQWEQEEIALHRKHGDVVRYGPNRYSLSSPEALKPIYGLGTQFRKSRWYFGHANPDRRRWDIFSDPDPRTHAERRRQFQAVYSMSSLVSYEAFVDECADLFETRLAEIAAAGVPVDMGHWLQCYAFDVIGLITYSKRIGFLDSGEDVGGIIASLEQSLQYGTLVGLYPSLHPPLSKALDWLAGGSGSGRTYVRKFTMDRMREHQTRPKAVTPVGEEKPRDGAPQDFLTRFFAKHAQDPEAFTTYHIFSASLGNVVAGSDTTSISLSSTLYYLLKRPETFRKLRVEVDARPWAQHFTFKETQDMPYLQAVIKEALRMHPAVGLPLERVVPEGGATLCGRFFPGGTIVGVNAWVLHRRKDIFGDDADEFNPERWLIADREKLALMDRNHLAFGLGSRTCIGRHISHLEMSKLIPLLVRDFDFELHGRLAQPGSSWEATNLWFVKPRNFKVVVKRRASTGKG